MEREGIIFNIQRFSIHDGPGIRTLVFFKGCNMRCKWCCNPESQNFGPELYFYSEKCIGCLACMNVCPQGAIKSTETGQTVTLRDLCKNCGNCTLVCYTRAREMKGQKMSVQEVVDMVKKDQAFYESSGGGVTLGGGEPLLRPGFAASVLEECKKSGIHSAIETAGYVSWSSFEAVLPFTDLFLFDLKHMDSKIHEAYTGVGNEIILANLRRLSGLTTNIIVRVPIIPDFNDHDAEILKIARFVSELKIRELHLLPYHRYGEEKYRYLGREYPFAGKKNIEDRKIERLKVLACSENLSVKVGG